MIKSNDARFSLLFSLIAQLVAHTHTHTHTQTHTHTHTHTHHRVKFGGEGQGEGLGFGRGCGEWGRGGEGGGGGMATTRIQSGLRERRETGRKQGSQILRIKTAFFTQNKPLSRNSSNPIRILYTKNAKICVTKRILSLYCSNGRYVSRSLC